MQVKERNNAMIRIDISKLRARLSYIREKEISLVELSKILGISRSTLYKINGSQVTRSIFTSETIDKLINGFFWALKPHLKAVSDKQLYYLIINDLLAEGKPVKFITSKRDQNRIEKQAAVEFESFPDFNTIHEADPIR